MKLSHLFPQHMNLPEKEIEHLTVDSRKATRTSVFFLQPKAKIEFAEQALKTGAFVVHSRQELSEGLYVEDVAAAFSQALQIFYKESFENLKIYGVTGTNGKTTFSYILKSFLEAYDTPTGIFGTISNSFNDHVLDTGLTSPLAEDFYAFNHVNYQRGMKVAVCEVSSHALDQKRLGVSFLSGAAFTSFSQDHLDYHKDMKSYLEAKKKISTEASREKAFLIGHSNVVEYEEFKAYRKFFIGEDYHYKIMEESLYGVKVQFTKGGASVEGRIPLLGDFNVENFILALAVLCEHFGERFFPDERVFECLKQIPGRLERTPLPNDSLAFVDYSHTPDSLEKSLSTLRKYSKDKQLCVVFGCGGDRDKEKRPLMGKVAVEGADHVIITSDNPRNEDPLAIISEISQGVSEQQSVQVISDRAEAIAAALERTVKEKSVVLIAGKGHETYQEIAGKKNSFSDQDQIDKWLASKT